MPGSLDEDGNEEDVVEGSIGSVMAYREKEEREFQKEREKKQKMRVADLLGDEK